MPPLFTTQEGSIRYYYNGADRFPSVTSIIKGGLPSPGLERWKQNQIAIRAADNRKELAKMNKADALKFIKDVYEDVDGRASAADHGNSVHAYIESFIKGEELPEMDEAGDQTIQQFDAFCREYSPTFSDSEFTCFSDQYGYAGTGDAEVTIRGVTYIMDFKTGKRVWPEVALQLAAYDRADWCRERGGGIRPVRRLGRGLVLHLRPDEYKLIQVDISDQTFQHFLSIKDTFDWINIQADYVLRGELAHDE